VLARSTDAAVITLAEDDVDQADRLRRVIARIGPADHVSVSGDRTQAIEAAIRSAGAADAVLIVGTNGGLRRDRAAAREMLEGATREASTWPAFS
jgi:UDP-N-acetylmuramyl tripeptide synthase